jgi:hypothetical protein
MCGENSPTLGSQSIANLNPWIYTCSFHFYYAINVARKRMFFGKFSQLGDLFFFKKMKNL